MADFKNLYYRLSGKMADTIEILDGLSNDLKNVQQETEEAYISSDETPIKLMDRSKEPKDPKD